MRMKALVPQTTITVKSNPTLKVIQVECDIKADKLITSNSTDIWINNEITDYILETNS